MSGVAGRRELVIRARQVMQARLSERDLKLTCVSGELFVSSRQLQRAFFEAGSEGFRRELSKMRVTRAVQLFYNQPQLSVAQVAASVGYSHAPFFARTFRSQMGCAPGEWHRRCLRRKRKENQGDQVSVGGISSLDDARRGL